MTAARGMTMEQLGVHLLETISSSSTGTRPAPLTKCTIAGIATKSASLLRKTAGAGGVTNGGECYSLAAEMFPVLAPMCVAAAACVASDGERSQTCRAAEEEAADAVLNIIAAAETETVPSPFTDFAAAQTQAAAQAGVQGHDADKRTRASPDTEIRLRKQPPSVFQRSDECDDDYKSLPLKERNRRSAIRSRKRRREEMQQLTAENEQLKRLCVELVRENKKLRRQLGQSQATKHP